MIEASTSDLVLPDCLIVRQNALPLRSRDLN
jgi:hypothetical protein